MSDHLKEKLSWVQVMVLEGRMEVVTEQDSIVSISAGGCYFVEPGDSHHETATEDTLVLVTQGEDRPQLRQSEKK